MKNLTFALYLACLFFLLHYIFGAREAKSEPFIEELMMKTESGQMITMLTPCPENLGNDFPNVVIASEGEPRDGAVIFHRGCGGLVNHVITIRFYEEGDKLTATYPEVFFEQRKGRRYLRSGNAHEMKICPSDCR